MNQEVVGFMAGALIATALLPQVIQSWITKSTKDISLPWAIINLTGQVLWIIYGILISSLSLVVMSSITCVMAVSVLILKFMYGVNK